VLVNVDIRLSAK